MAVKNKTRNAILGVLSLMSGSGYDIKKFCDKSISHFWNENFGHIYPVLAELQEEGLIEQVNAADGVRRKVYGITEKGREEFIDWLLQPVEYQPARSELLLKIAFGANIPKEKTIQMLREVLERKERQLKEYKAIEASGGEAGKNSGNASYQYWLAPLRYGIMVTEAVVLWCRETIGNMEKYAESPKGPESTMLQREQEK